MPAAVTLNAEQTLPADGSAGTLAGRVWRPDVEGPSVVAIRADGVFDVTKSFPTMRDLCETRDPAASLNAHVRRAHRHACGHSHQYATR